MPGLWSAADGGIGMLGGGGRGRGVPEPAEIWQMHRGRKEKKTGGGVGDLVLVVHWARAFCVIREVCFGALDRRGLDGSDRNPWVAGSFHFIGSCKLLVPFNPSRKKN